MTKDIECLIFGQAFVFYLFKESFCLVLYLILNAFIFLSSSFLVGI